MGGKNIKVLRSVGNLYFPVSSWKYRCGVYNVGKIVRKMVELIKIELCVF